MAAQLKLAEPIGESSSLSDIGARAGRLGVEIADMAGLIGDLTALGDLQSARAQAAVAAAEEMTRTNTRLSGTMQSVRESVTAAQTTLRESADTVSASLTGAIEKIGSLGDGAIALKAAIENVAATIRQVQETSGAIRRIADDTQLLALNASIEAAHAGSAGAGFAIIAAAVKGLAEQVHTSTKANQQNLELLTETLAELLRKADGNSAMALAAKAQSAQAQDSIGALHTLVETVEGVTQGISEMCGEVDASRDSYAALQEELTDLVAAVGDGGDKLERAKERADSILGISEDFILFIAESGIETPDHTVIALCQRTAGNIAALFERAVDGGEIAMADLFDDRYAPVPKTDPQQVTTRFVRFTDRVLPPLQEPLLTADPRIVFCAAVDRNGYLPTHNLKYSQPQRNDPVWNSANCRNRRIFNDRTGLAAGRSDKPFLLQTYRRDMGGGQFVLMKDVSAPIRVSGRHWGGFRIGFKA